MKRKMQPHILEYTNIVFSIMGGQMGAWNLGSLSGTGEVCEELREDD